jgi:hypothetical protein
MDQPMHGGAANMPEDAASESMSGAMRDAGGHALDAGRAHDAGRPDAGSMPHDAGTAVDGDATPQQTNDASTAGRPPDIVFDDPMFFPLPLDSIRYGVSGHDAETDLCISVIWYFQGINDTRFCSDDAMDPTPDVVVEAGTPAGCWDYRGNAELVAMRGCADFGMLTDTDDDSVDLDVDVHSDLWTGTVRFKNTP